MASNANGIEDKRGERATGIVAPPDSTNANDRSFVIDDAKLAVTEDADVVSSLETETVNSSIEVSESKPTESSDIWSTSWKGWAELENDPVIFTTLLREWGVGGVVVREVIPLDAVFDIPASSMLGLIFLSRYVTPEQEGDSLSPAGNLWFANQTSSFSCATVALMNVINNRSDVDLGTSVTSFRESTIDLLPRDRGLALDGFEKVRDVHNSFSTENDRLNVDHRLKDDAKAAARKKRRSKLKKGRKGKRSNKWDEDEESGFHFIAYVPVHGEVWRMDGLERLPSSLGALADAENWVAMVIPHLEAQWQSAAINELEFSLLSVVAENASADLAEQEQEKMKRKREDWGPMLAQFLQLHAEKGDVAEKLG